MDKQDAIQELNDYYATKKELKEAIKSGDVTDAIHEIADNNVDVYTYDLLKWLPDNYDKVEDAISEFGFPENNEGSPDMIKAIMIGQYIENQEVLNEVVEEMKK